MNEGQNQPPDIAVSAIRAIGAGDITELLGKAETSERKRSHLLLHGGHHDQVQRLAIMLECGSYVRPHQHSAQWEMLALLRGCCDVLQFSPQGRLISRIEMSAACPIVQIPIGTWHGLYVCESATMLLEIKPGPYRPNEFADWAPAEGDPAVPQYLARLAR
ncbi:MAG TPA: WbuC family cupin fold metalloprotein [Xanthobacteraceae bacterium]|nr:WbuC family cupin fold metalloprotein [Xanthobacteraceae bacterium]